MTDRKRKRKVEERADPVDVRLAAYGERFMQMFEDADSRQPAAEQAQPLHSSSDSEASNSLGVDGGTDLSEEDSDSGADSEPAGAAAEFIFDNRAVLPKGTHQHQQQARPPQRALVAAPKVKQRNPQGPQKPTAAAGSRGPLLDAKQERKAFMSSKAAKVHSKGAAGAGSGSARHDGPVGAAADEVDAMSREEFLKLRREVELYGAAALDKRSKKRFEAAMLTQLGGRAQKSPRIPAKIGLGMAKKAAQRDARALEEAIDAGMVKRKGLGRKKREEKRQSLDRGLMEDKGAFKGGIMKVRRGAGGASRGGAAIGKRRGR
ncbi:hypothetical protein N2152v2_009396 [Parachlorella kessleri]